MEDGADMNGLCKQTALGSEYEAGGSVVCDQSAVEVYFVMEDFIHEGYLFALSSLSACVCTEFHSTQLATLILFNGTPTY